LGVVNALKSPAFRRDLDSLNSFIGRPLQAKTTPHKPGKNKQVNMVCPFPHRLWPALLFFAPNTTAHDGAAKWMQDINRRGQPEQGTYTQLALLLLQIKAIRHPVISGSANKRKRPIVSDDNRPFLYSAAMR